MYVEPVAAILVLTLMLLAYQQYKIISLDSDIEEIATKYNSFVDEVTSTFESLLEDIEDVKRDIEDTKND